MGEPSRPERSAAEIIEPFGTRRIAKRRKATDTDPARRLTVYFLDRWTDDKIRPLDSRGETAGYIRSTFLRPKGGRTWTEEEVRQMIDDFMVAVVRQDAVIKDGQSAWKCFTGWWGRRPVVQDDSDARRRYTEERRRLTHGERRT